MPGKKPKLLFNSEGQWIVLDRGDLKNSCEICSEKLTPIEEECYYLCRRNSYCFHSHCSKYSKSEKKCMVGTIDKPHIHIKISAEAKIEEKKNKSILTNGET